MQQEDKEIEYIVKLVDNYLDGQMTAGELLDHAARFCAHHPNENEKVLDLLADHPDRSVQEAARQIREWNRQAREQIKDIVQIRRTSPLQPGVALLLYGGYDAAYAEPWWLSGREYYRATFIDFIDRGADKMPAAFVELKEELDMINYAGFRHRGRYALLNLLTIADWDASGTVMIHVVDGLPADPKAFYAGDPFRTALETHAQYRISRE